MLEGKGTLPEWWGCMTRRLSGPAEAVLARPGQPEHQNSDNTGLCVCVCCVCVCVLVTQSCLTLQLHGLKPTRLLCPWDSPGKNNGVGSHSLLQGIVPTQGSNSGLWHCRQIFYHLSHQGSPYPLQTPQFCKMLASCCWHPAVGNQRRLWEV